MPFIIKLMPKYSVRGNKVKFGPVCVRHRHLRFENLNLQTKVFLWLLFSFCEAAFLSIQFVLFAFQSLSVEKQAKVFTSSICINFTSQTLLNMFFLISGVSSFHCFHQGLILWAKNPFNQKLKSVSMSTLL